MGTVIAYWVGTVIAYWVGTVIAHRVGTVIAAWCHRGIGGCERSEPAGLRAERAREIDIERVLGKKDLDRVLEKKDLDRVLEKKDHNSTPRP